MNVCQFKWEDSPNLWGCLSIQQMVGSTQPDHFTKKSLGYLFYLWAAKFWSLLAQLATKISQHIVIPTRPDNWNKKEDICFTQTYYTDLGPPDNQIILVLLQNAMQRSNKYQLLCLWFDLGGIQLPDILELRWACLPWHHPGNQYNYKLEAQNAEPVLLTWHLPNQKTLNGK